MYVLALVAGQSERNQGQSRAIAAYVAPIRLFLPDGERHLGLGSDDCRNPDLATCRGFRWSWVDVCRTPSFSSG